MTTAVDRVAEAIRNADLPGRRAFSELTESERNDYRRMAEAAIDALGLTQECGRPDLFIPEVRWVSGWERAE